jgi:Protein of unknown function (DUF1045)
MQRYAIYWAPRAESALAEFGRRWLGGDPEQGAPSATRDLYGLDPALVERATAAPRRYGLHATMKAPFRLAPDVSQSELNAALHAFCARRRRVVAGPLRLTRFARWLALIPTAPLADLDWLAAECVVHFDQFRASLSAEDRARRAGLTDPLARRYLEEFGYPHVLAAFAFHITLAGPAEPRELDAIEAALRPAIAPFTEAPFALEDLCWFGEPDIGGLFKLCGRAPLTR